MVRGQPWVLMGDFNAALNLEDIFSGSSIINASMIEFKDCVANIEVVDINASGLHYTWNQELRRGKGILKKLDRCIGNMEFINEYVGADAMKLRSCSRGCCFTAVENLHDRVTKLHFEVEEIQKALDKNPADPILREEEAVYVHAFNEAKLDEERFLKSRIEVIRDANGVEYTGLSVPEAFVNHYKDFLGTDMLCDDMDSTDLFLKQVSESSYNDMVRVITNAEIKSAMFDIGDDRAPGPDGFSSAFFKKGWDIMGDDVCKSIRDFFGNGQILKEINHTFIALIPK
ncbi:hypothetical protein Tco_1250231, partial [Tanacetum coccineum]